MDQPRGSTSGERLRPPQARCLPSRTPAESRRFRRSTLFNSILSNLTPPPTIPKGSGRERALPRWSRRSPPLALRLLRGNPQPPRTCSSAAAEGGELNGKQRGSQPAVTGERRLAGKPRGCRHVLEAGDEPGLRSGRTQPRLPWASSAA